MEIVEKETKVRYTLALTLYQYYDRCTTHIFFFKRSITKEIHSHMMMSVHPMTLEKELHTKRLGEKLRGSCLQ